MFNYKFNKNETEIKSELNNFKSKNKRELDNLLSKYKSILNEKTDNKIPSNQNLPLNGNTFAVKTFIQSINDATPMYLILLLEYLNYFAGFWLIEDDDELNNVLPELIYSMIVFGNAGIQNENGKISIYACYNSECDNSGNLTNATGIVFNPFILCGRVKDNFKFNEVNLTNIDTAFFKWGVTGLTMLFTLNPFIKQQILIINSMFDNHDLLLKKFKYIINNGDPRLVEFELENLIESRSRIAVLLGRKFNGSQIASSNTKSGQKISYQVNSEILKRNEIEPLEINLNLLNEDSHNNYNYLYNLISKIIGRYSNISYKSERNIKSEVDINNAIFDIINNSYENQLLKGIEKYNKLFNKKAKLVKLLDKKRRLEQEMENENINNEFNKWNKNTDNK